MSGVVEALGTFANQFGYPGIFAVSLLGSVVPFVPLPYLVIVVLLSETQNPLLLGLAAGVGGALGKLTSYFLGRFGYLAVGRQTQENLDVLHDVMTRYGAFGVFVFSVTPLPDDVYLIPMGIVRLPFWRFFLANLAGKIVLSTLVAYLGRAYLGSLESVMGDSIVAIASAAILTVLVSVLLMRADWVLAVRIAKSEGTRGLLLGMRRILRL